MPNAWYKVGAQCLSNEFVHTTEITEENIPHQRVPDPKTRHNMLLFLTQSIAQDTQLAIESQYSTKQLLPQDK